MGRAILDLGLGHGRCGQGWIGCGSHWQTSQHLVIDWQVIRVYLVRALVVGALDYAVLGQFTDALAAEGVPAGERRRLLIVMIIRLEADAAFEN